MNIIGMEVINKKFGKGTVADIVDGRVRVLFPVREVKFVYPKAFADGYLTIEDKTIQDELVRLAIEEENRKNEEKAAKKLEQEKKADEEKKLRKNHRSVVRRGDTFATHAEALNECFGYDYKHFQRAYLKVDDSTAVWFPSIARRVMGEFIAADNSFGWLNVLAENDTILYSKNVEDANKNSDDIDIDTRDRYIFAKFDGDTCYTFIGVYSAEQKVTENGFKHVRIGTAVNLDTMTIIE